MQITEQQVRWRSWHGTFPLRGFILGWNHYRCHKALCMLFVWLHYLLFSLSGFVVWFGPNNYHAVVLKHYLHKKARVTVLPQRTQSWKWKYLATRGVLPRSFRVLCATARQLPGPAALGRALAAPRAPRRAPCCPELCRCCGFPALAAQQTRESLRISRGLRTTNIFSFSQKIIVLCRSWSHLAARLSQPPGFCKVLVLLLGVRRSPGPTAAPRALLPAGGSSRVASVCGFHTAFFSPVLIVSRTRPR